MMKKTHTEKLPAQYAWLYNKKLNVTWSELTNNQRQSFVSWWSSKYNDGSVMIAAQYADSETERSIENCIPFSLDTVLFKGDIRLVLSCNGGFAGGSMTKRQLAEVRDTMDSGFICPLTVKLRSCYTANLKG